MENVQYSFWYLPQKEANFRLNLNAYTFDTTAHNRLMFGTYSCFVTVYRRLKTTISRICPRSTFNTDW